MEFSDEEKDEEDEYQPVIGQDDDEGEEEDARESDESKAEREQQSRHALWVRTNLNVLFSFSITFYDHVR